jgi:hypothetical protein
MESNVKLSLELQIEKGRGYVPSEENKTASAAIGTIFVGFHLYPDPQREVCRGKLPRRTENGL